MVCFCFFKVDALVPAFSSHLYRYESLLGSLDCLRLSFSSLYSSKMLGGKAIVNPVSFRNFLKLFSCFFPCFASSPAGWNVSSLFRTSHVLMSFPLRWAVLSQTKFLHNSMYGAFYENGSQRFTESGTIRGHGPVGVSMVFLKEVCHWGLALKFWKLNLGPA